MDNKLGALETIFDGAYDCTVTQGGQGEAPVVLVSQDGGLDFSCLSLLKIENGCAEFPFKGGQKVAIAFSQMRTQRADIPGIACGRSRS